MAKTWCKGLVAMVLGSGAAMAAAQPAPSQLIGLTAAMNEMALACGDLSAQELQMLRQRQRSEMVGQLISGSEYDKAYAQARDDFLRKWKSGSAAAQKKSCAQMQRGSAQGPAKLP